MKFTHQLGFVAMLIASASSFSCGNSVAPASPEHEQVTEISILKLDSLQRAHPEAILLDVRSDEEWAAGHVAGASYVSFDWDHRKDPLSGIPWNRPVFVYCEAGGRSGVVTEELRIMGHPHIFDLIGGMEQWMENDGALAFDEPIPLAQKTY